jgi:hypothetical protein
MRARHSEGFLLLLLILAVIRGFCWLFLAAILSPPLSKGEHFLGRGQTAGCFFAGLSAGISGGYRGSRAAEKRLT